MRLPVLPPIAAVACSDAPRTPNSTDAVRRQPGGVRLALRAVLGAAALSAGGCGDAASSDAGGATDTASPSTDASGSSTTGTASTTGASTGTATTDASTTADTTSDPSTTSTSSTTAASTSDTASDTDTSAASTTAASTSDSDTTGGGEFEPIDCPTAVPDPLTSRLCPASADPEGAPDKIFIECAVETACYAPSVPPAKDELVVVAYNIERGLKLDQILAGFASGQLPDADVVLISETDRGCSRTDGRDVTRELAQALAMNYVFAVEFVELPRVGGPGGTIEAPCEHGNAVLSKYPLGNVQALRHAMAKEWYGGDEPRLGGRISVGADVLVGDRVLHAWSLHFESDISETYRAPQAAELADVAAMGASTGAVVVGGDTNAGTYVVDIGLGTMNNPTVKAFTDRGYLDAHRSLPALQRPTRDPLVLDLIFTLGDIASAPGICPLSSCPFSDHAPVWATVALR